MWRWEVEVTIDNMKQRGSVTVVRTTVLGLSLFKVWKTAENGELCRMMCGVTLRFTSRFWDLESIANKWQVFYSFMPYNIVNPTQILSCSVRRFILTLFPVKCSRLSQISQKSAHTMKSIDILFRMLIFHSIGTRSLKGKWIKVAKYPSVLGLSFKMKCIW